MTEPSNVREELRHEEARESLKERLEREHRELIEELRALIPGAEVLFGFLLAIRFTSEFSQLSTTHIHVYYATLLSTGVALVCFLAPAAHHRFRFREAEKENVVEKGNRDAIAGCIAISLAFTGVIYLVTGLLFGAVASALVAAAFFLLVAWRWWLVSLVRERRTRRSEASSKPAPAR